MKKTIIWIIALLILIVPTIAINSNSTSNSEWLMSGRTLDNNRYSDGNSINLTNSKNSTVNFGLSSNQIEESLLYKNSTLFVSIFDGSNRRTYRVNVTGTTMIEDVYAGQTQKGVAVIDGYIYTGNIGLSPLRFKSYYPNNMSEKDESQSIGGSSTSCVLVYNDAVYHIANNNIFMRNYTDLTQLHSSNSDVSFVDECFAVDTTSVFALGYQTLRQLDVTSVNVQLNSYNTGSIITSGVVSSGDYIYFGTSDNKLYQINSSNVSIKIAEYTGTNDFIELGMYNDNYLYFPAADGKVYQFNKTNITSPINTLNLGGTLTLGILGVGDSLYIPQEDVLHQVELNNISNYLGNITLNGAISTSPIFADDRIFVYTNDTVYMLYENTTVEPLNITDYDFYPNQTTSGNNITFNATVIGDTDSVWVRIWQGITTIATQALSFISGNLWSGEIETNDSFIGISNVTFYANATNGTEINVTSAEQLNITSNNTPPVIVINSPSNNKRINTKNYVLDVNFTVTDDKNDIANCSLIVNDEINVTNSSINTNGTYIISTTLSGGRWEIKINCTDNDGATGDPPINITIPYEQTRTFMVDMNGINYSAISIDITGLQYNSTYPSNISVDLGSDLSQEWNYSGTLSGSTTATIPKADLDNWIANNCTALPIPIYHDYCPINLLFKSDTQGSLNVTNISTTYEENTTNWPGGIDINYWLDYYNNTWLNNLTLTAWLNASDITDWSQNNCTGETDNFETTVSSFLSGILLLDELEITYVSNISPIEIKNATVDPGLVFPGDNVTINATVNISGAIYEVNVIQQELFNGGFANTDEIPGQNFTAGGSGWISRIDIFDVGSTTGNLTLNIYEGPGGDLLDSATVTNYSSGWIIFDFGDDLIKIDKNSEYFFNVSSDASSWNNLGYSNTSTYNNGTLFIDGTPDANKDLMFRILTYDYYTDSVWARIWSGVTTWITKALTYIGNNLWSTNITSNSSWGSDVNVTIYANTTDGANATPVNLNFSIANVTDPIYQNLNVTPASPQNYSNLQIYEFTIDCISPYGIQSVIIEHNFTGSLTNYSMLYSGSGDTYIYSWTGIFAGNSSWQITCEDNYNLTNSTSIQNYEVYKADPNLRITILPSATPSFTETVNVTCLSDSSESTKIMYMDSSVISNPTSAVFSTGNYFLECNQSESDNYLSDYVNRTMTVVDTQPSVNLTNPACGYTFPGSTNQVLLQFNVSDLETQELDVNIYVNDSIETSFSTNDTENGYLLNVTSNTTYNWSVSVSDGNNLIESNLCNFTIGPITADIPPTVNLLFPGNGDNLANTFNYINYSFLLNDTDSTNLDYNLVVDDFSRCSDSVTSNAIYDCEVGPFVPNSSHCWYVNVTDYTTIVQSSEWCFSINSTCTPNWLPQYTSCLITNENVKYYTDSNSCGNLSTIPADNGTATTCDYCVPSYYCSAYHACTRDSVQTCAVVSDNNNCCAQTGLPSDCYSGDRSEFTRTCTYESALVVIPREAGAIIAIFLNWITSPLGMLLLSIVCLAIIFAIGLIIASYIRNTQT